MRVRLSIASLVALAACGEPFDPPSRVDKLRLLAIRAEAPEIAPPVRGEDGAPLDPQPEGHAPDRTALTALVADPLQLADPAREVTVVYLGCTPEPGSVEANLCSLIETYADPTQLAALLSAGGGSCAGGGGSGMGPIGEGVIGGVNFAGVESCDHELGCRQAEVTVGGLPLALPTPTYVLPAAFELDALPAGHPQRTLGVQVTMIAIAVAASPQELVEGADPADDCAFVTKVSDNLARLLEERERLTAIKRVQVRGPDNDDEVNVNPEIAGIRAAGAVLPAELPDPPPAEAIFRRGQEVKLLPLLPAGPDGQPLSSDRLYQPFTRYDGEGKPFRDEREAWVWSWFTTGGAFERERTRAADQEQVWFTTGEDDDLAVPADGRVFLYGVVRDARGGIAWVRREVRVE